MRGSSTMELSRNWGRAARTVYKWKRIAIHMLVTDVMVPA